MGRLSLIFFLLIPIYLLSQSNENQVLIFCESRSDSTDLANDFYNLIDSMSKGFYPAEDLYVNWNTNKISYRVNDSINRIDSAKITLLNSAYHEMYVHPFKGRVTSRFGYRRSRFHSGIDIDLNTGDPVYAAFDGMVRITTYDYGFGNVVVVRHNNGLETVYAHLHRIAVDSNQNVKAGDLLGYGGNTGRSYGSHLHFEVRYLGVPMNPEAVIDFDRFILLSDTLIVTNKSFKPTPSKTDLSNAKYYTVRSGDTLSAIAKRNKTSVSRICSLNGIRDTKILQIGEKLRIR